MPSDQKTAIKPIFWGFFLTMPCLARPSGRFAAQTPTKPAHLREKTPLATIASVFFLMA